MRPLPAVEPPPELVRDHRPGRSGTEDDQPPHRLSPRSPHESKVTPRGIGNQWPRSRADATKAATSTGALALRVAEVYCDDWCAGKPGRRRTGARERHHTMAAINGAPEPLLTPLPLAAVRADRRCTTPPAAAVRDPHRGSGQAVRRDLGGTGPRSHAFPPVRCSVSSGPNGAGKSTTIRLLLGMARPTAGRAWLAGHRVEDVAQAHRHVAYVPADVALWPHLTGREVLELVAHLGSPPDLAYRRRAGRAVRSGPGQTVPGVLVGESAEGRVGGGVRHPGPGADLGRADQRPGSADGARLPGRCR